MNAQINEARWPLALIAVCLASTALAQSTGPIITGVRTEGTNLVITASVPAAVQRITLETSDRLNRLRWAPRAVMRPQAQAQAVTFRFPISQPMELIRIRADATEPLPSTFFQGTNAYSAPSDVTVNRNGDFSGVSVGGTPPGGPSRDVVESDIWQLRGSTMYFFNQYRGLQIIDISNPDKASVRGTLELPAAGDQMYLLGNDHVVLLARDGCDYSSSQILVVADTDGAPQTVARLPVSGSIRESRLVGTALYVASQTLRPVSGTTNTVWEWGTLVSAFDLANPSVPLSRNTLWFSGYGNVVSATDTYLFVVTQSPSDWWQSVVNLVDITDPLGTMAAYGAITNRGQVPDKFKLNYSDEVFAVISEDRHQTNGAPLVTRLETFHLPDPRTAGPLSITRLGELELGQGERLHATRFDGNRAYVVTFFQIDPLWIVDFSNPSMPHIAGSVEVPGWSTFIQPLGNRLVTLGTETNHVSVSLYDVSNPAVPARLSQVRLGANYSWSVANYDEKAFAVLPDAGLVLVPFSGDATNGYTSALQLIDYSPAELRARGQVRSSSGLSYRRATVFKERILSLSDWELASVDATDRDNPTIRGRLELAESIDRVILAGDYVLQLSTGNLWNATTPGLSVVAANAPNTVLEHFELLPLPLLGATKRDNWLYLAQGSPDLGIPTSEEGARFALTVLNLEDLPSLTVAAQIVTNSVSLGWSGNWQALWPQPGVLVWAGGQDYWCCYDLWIGGGPLGGPGWFWRPWSRGSGGNGLLVAFDVNRPEAPRLASQVDLRATNRWSFSRSFVADGLVFLSHQTSEFIPDPIPTNTGTWIYRSFLNVVDFTEPADPLVRKPVNIPNPLAGVAESAALVFSLGSHWPDDPTVGWREFLDASAYDGISAYLVDSLPLPAAWPHPAVVLGASVVVANPGDNSTTNVVPATVETWTLTDSRKFFRSGSLLVSVPISDLGYFDGLLAGASYDSRVDLFNASDPAKLVRVGCGRPPVCWWWPNLEQAAGDLSSGLWLPLGAYGVSHVQVGK